jgi:hypothetical protein
MCGGGFCAGTPNRSPAGDGEPGDWNTGEVLDARLVRVMTIGEDEHDADAMADDNDDVDDDALVEFERTVVAAESRPPETFEVLDVDECDRIARFDDSGLAIVVAVVVVVVVVTGKK